MVRRLGPLRGGGGASRPGLPGGLRVPGGYGMHLGPAVDGVGFSRRAPVPRGYGRRGPG